MGDSETSVTDFLVNIDVDDLPKAVAFYGSAFGLKVGRRFGSGGVELLGGPAPIYLLVKVSGTAATSTTKQVRNYARHWTPVHLDFVVKDIRGSGEEGRFGWCHSGGVYHSAQVGAYGSDGRILSEMTTVLSRS